MEINKEKYLKKFQVQKKVNYEFQATGVSMSKKFKGNIWFLFYKYPLRKIQEAYKICQSKGIYTIPFIIGVLNKIT